MFTETFALITALANNEILPIGDLDINTGFMQPVLTIDRAQVSPHGYLYVFLADGSTHQVEPSDSIILIPLLRRVKELVDKKYIGVLVNSGDNDTLICEKIAV